ncbi:cellular nucleic acid-binding protein [Trifolium repens]|nr:cellular nucleic acid-binding protein [Trifolium repens]
MNEARTSDKIIRCSRVTPIQSKDLSSTFLRFLAFRALMSQFSTIVATHRFGAFIRLMTGLLTPKACDLLLVIVSNRLLTTTLTNLLLCLVVIRLSTVRILSFLIINHLVVIGLGSSINVTNSTLGHQGSKISKLRETNKMLHFGS